MAAGSSGTYGVGVVVTGPTGPLLTLSGTANRSYGEEYRQGGPDMTRLTRLAATTGGRIDIAPGQAFDAADLPVGRRMWSPAGWLLVAAALAWLAAVALSRLAVPRRASLRAVPGSLRPRTRALLRSPGLLRPRAALRARAGRDTDRSPPGRSPPGDDDP
jgi:hypothetical protein